MPEILTESFCERCGTRYTFEATAPAKTKKLGKFKTLSKGLKNYVLSDENSLDEALAAARSDEDREATAQQLEAFQATFNFCMTCRQYTCANCWNAAVGACLTCAPLNGHAAHSTTFLDVVPLAPVEPLSLERSPWPTADVSRGAAAAEADGATATHDEANGTEFADRLGRFTEPSVTADVPGEHAADPAGAPSAWPIEAEQAASPAASLDEPEAIDAVAGIEAAADVAEADVAADRAAEDPIAADVVLESEPSSDAAEPTAEAEVVADEAPADPIAAEVVLESEPSTDAADWAMAETEASIEFEPLAVVDVEAVAADQTADIEAEPATAEADAAIPVGEPNSAPAGAHVFENDIAPAIAERADVDARAAAAARRTSDLLARLRPTAASDAEPEPAPIEATVEPESFTEPSVPDDVLIIDMVAAPTTPIEEPDTARADLAVAEFEVADYVIGDYEAVEPAPDEPVAPPPWPVEPAAAALPPELLAVIGPAIDAAPEPADELEAVAAPDTSPDEAVAEPVDVAASDATESPESVPTTPEPEPARADVVEQPTWRIVAPDAVVQPTNGHKPHPEPDQPIVVASAPGAPAPAIEPQWPAPPQAAILDADPGFLLSRRGDATPGQWAAAPIPLTPGPVAAPIIGIQTCVGCGLSLSATARFCRRCGSRQGA
jgi:hypothetical protein